MYGLGEFTEILRRFLDLGAQYRERFDGSLKIAEIVRGARSGCSELSAISVPVPGSVTTAGRGGRALSWSAGCGGRALSWSAGGHV